MIEAVMDFLNRYPRGRTLNTRALCAELNLDHEKAKSLLYTAARNTLQFYHRRTPPTLNKLGKSVSYYQWGNPATFGPSPIPTTREPDIRDKLLQLEGSLARIEEKVDRLWRATDPHRDY